MILSVVSEVKDPPNPMPAEQAKPFRRRLLAWYRKHRRDLPWRPRKNEQPVPYHTLVSEAMLQQTQVATVVPYFHQFIAAFPTVQDLADADEQQVLTLWQGLGYYRRARNLHAAAKAIVAEHGGEVPSCVTLLRQLPGVGRYTAGAIASIAHGTQAAVVDGNVERVFARLLLITDPINAPATKKHVWSIAEPLVPKANPGDYNQALMELGAMICTPKLPKCFVCPVRVHCRGVQETNPEALPVKLAKKKPTDVTHVVIAAERNGKYLFEKRPSEGLWSNMWQLPTYETAMEKGLGNRRVTTRGTSNDSPTTGPPRSDAAVSVTMTDWFQNRFNLQLEHPTPAIDFTHQTTHRTIRFVVLHANVKSGRLKANAGLWRRIDQLNDLPMSNPQREAIESLHNT